MDHEEKENQGPDRNNEKQDFLATLAEMKSLLDQESENRHIDEQVDFLVKVLLKAKDKLKPVIEMYTDIVIERVKASRTQPQFRDR